MAGEQIVKDGEIVKDIVDDPKVDDIDDPKVDDVDDPKVDDVDDPKVDDDDDDDDDPKEESWMANEDDLDDGQLDDVPVATHIRMKQKLKGKLKDTDEELQKLKDENEALKAGVAVQSAPKDLPKRPREQDFDTIAEYDEALLLYDDKMLTLRLNAAEQRREISRHQRTAKANMEAAVDSHYDRAAELIEKNKIDVKVYKAADTRVREIVETVKPGLGDTVTDSLISIIGDGSEKVLYFLGRNTKALSKFKDLLVNDPSGLKASMFLGQQKQRLLNSGKKISKARPPADDITGDNKSGNAKGGALLKKREAAQKKGDVQLAYDLKKQAREQGIDVSKW